jgi:hypothetical protein
VCYNTVPLTLSKHLSGHIVRSPNVIASVHRSRLHDFAIRTMRKNMKSSSDGVDTASKKCRHGSSGTCGGVWPHLRLGGSLESGGQF